MQFIEKLLLLLAMLMYTKGVFCRLEIYKQLMIVTGNYLFILINIYTNLKARFMNSYHDLEVDQN